MGKVLALHALLALCSLSLVDATDKLPCDYQHSVNIVGGTFHSNGSVTFDGQEYRNGSYGLFRDSLYRSMDYISDKNRTILRGCFCHLKNHKPCLPFCCPNGFLKREDSLNECQPYIREMYLKTDYDKKFRVMDKYRVVQGASCGPHNRLNTRLGFDEWKLLDNGSILIRGIINDVYDYDSYCFDQLLMPDSNIKMEFTICLKNNALKAKLHYTSHFYQKFGMVISIIFLFITLLIYAFLPELRNLRGKALMCYMAAIIIFYTFLFINTEQFKVGKGMCSMIGYISFGTALIAIFLLNVINIDYFATFYFKNFREKYKNKIFCVYLLYGVGVPLIFVLASFLDGNITKAIKDQKLDLGTCFMHRDRTSLFFYFYLITTITLVINLLMLILTACKMFKIRRERTMDKLERYCYNESLEREKFIHILGFFLGVDLTWILEAVCFIFDIRTDWHYTIEFLGYSQGLWIFVFCILRVKFIWIVGKRCCGTGYLSDERMDSGLKYSRTNSNLSHPDDET